MRRKLLMSFFNNDAVNSIGAMGNAIAQAQLYASERNLQAQQNSRLLAMEFERKEAQKNREWQEKMANTQYQRAMADMKRAGLNPILAYQQGGNAVPQGSSAQGFTINGAQGKTSRLAAGMQALPETLNVIERIATSGYRQARNSSEFKEVSKWVGLTRDFLNYFKNDYTRTVLDGKGFTVGKSNQHY